MSSPTIHSESGIMKTLQTHTKLVQEMQTQELGPWDPQKVEQDHMKGDDHGQGNPCWGRAVLGRSTWGLDMTQP